MANPDPSRYRTRCPQFDDLEDSKWLNNTGIPLTCRSTKLCPQLHKQIESIDKWRAKLTNEQTTLVECSSMLAHISHAQLRMNRLSHNIAGDFGLINKMKKHQEIAFAKKKEVSVQITEGDTSVKTAAMYAAHLIYWKS